MPGGIWGLDHHNYYTKIVASYLEAFRSLGHATALVDAGALEGRLGREIPAAVLDLNFEGKVAGAMGGLGIAYVSHVWDAWIQSPRTPPRMEGYLPRGLDYAFTFDPRQVEAFRALGVRHAEYLPACCDLETFRPLELAPEEKARYGDRISFYATPSSDPDAAYLATLEQIRRMPGDQARRAGPMLEAAMAAQEEDLFRYRFPELLSGEEKARGIWLLSPEASPAKETLVHRMSLHVSQRQRIEAARALAPLGISVWGPDDWKPVLVPGMRHRGMADFQADLPRLINASDILLNVPKCHSLAAVPPRVFEILACGGFLLTTEGEGLGRYFRDGEDLVVFRSREELLEKARHYLEHPEERRRIAACGRDKVRREHGFLPRARRIADVLARDGIL